MRLSGKIAVVTGAASGIGRASAHLFAQEGARVLAVDLSAGRLEEAHHGRDAIRTLAQDVSADDAGERIVSAALEFGGALDVVMNNAGVASNALAEAMTNEQWDHTINVNLRAQFLLCRAAIPYLKRSSAGRIVNIASVMAEETDYGLAAYCASKAGVAGLTRTLALELGKFGITANYILPGAILTGMTSSSFENEDIAQVWARKSAVRRLGAPEDIARAALFLASEDSGFVTGHGLVVDGGLTLRT
jgi:3-oxoacyl-[acyl-carrier protein] reductase